MLLMGAGLSSPAWAGRDPAPSAQGDASATGTVTNSPSNNNNGAGRPTADGGTVSPAVQQSMNRAAAAINASPSLSNLSQGAISGTPVSSDQIAAARQATAATAVRNRRGGTSGFASVRAAIQEYGGSPETAELAAALLNGMSGGPSGGTPSLALTQTAVELTLSMQGLVDSGEVSADQLLSSIEAFNRLVLQLSPPQLASLTEDEQMQELKSILETLAAAASA